MKIVALVICFYLTLRTSKTEDTAICDDGLANIEVDLLSVQSVECHDERIVIHQYYEPAGDSYCQDNTRDGRPVCLSETILYDAPLPLSGDYRPLSPRYGEYKYLPPQRWLHALKYGAIVFLYHPCAPLDQVMELKKLAKSCLWKHIITPSVNLTTDKPFALVSWGCRFVMSWIDWEPAARWIIEHSLQTPESIVVQDGQYEHDLIEPSIMADYNQNTVCSSTVNDNNEDNSQPPDGEVDKPISNDGANKNNDSDSNIINTTPPPLLPSNTNTECLRTDDSFECQHHNRVVIILHNYPVLYGLIILMVVVMLVLVVAVGYLYCYRHACFFSGQRKRPLGRYKPCGQFYREAGGNNSGLITGIAIPELGLPKTVQSEREKLLLESDEDDL